MFSVKTVADVLKNFNKTIDDLRKVASKNADIALQARIDIGQAQLREADANEEMQKAEAIAQKLEALIGA